ncbi:unnamed protein product [Darwinula stevensoni]|uniref:Uncharacterized protein n=1 Tax=Darwinula stevensoni TaxID=69355 RepID=A0A7R8X3M4_9CRUS|nr:unnamed protein product [Darwinula stevensoni]CAG0882498.1 unnamed protein product [Darwinula stevensoni]
MSTALKKKVWEKVAFELEAQFPSKPKRKASPQSDARSKNKRTGGGPLLSELTIEAQKVLDTVDGALAVHLQNPNDEDMLTCRTLLRVLEKLRKRSRQKFQMGYGTCQS